ncbi:hypothetical protein ACIBSR_03290 [Streptomyces sp. NPDC049936]|uniref:hypothetical protein n=1 Tax=Streptomyces sp. NPDC049936 TaxID=3365599 RepID=UPI0037A088E2
MRQTSPGELTARACSATNCAYSRALSFTTEQYRHSAAHPLPSSLTIVRRSHVGQVTGSRTLTGSMPETRRRVFVRPSNSSAKSETLSWRQAHSMWSSRNCVSALTVWLTGF